MAGVQRSEGRARSTGRTTDDGSYLGVAEFQPCQAAQPVAPIDGADNQPGAEGDSPSQHACVTAARER
jgi:hypothetical protein